MRVLWTNNPYGEKQYKAEIKDLSDDQVIELAGNLTSGVPMGTPVFDGAVEAIVDHRLKVLYGDGSGIDIDSFGIPGKKLVKNNAQR